MQTRSVVVVLGLVSALGAALAACSSSSGGDGAAAGGSGVACNTDPWSCAAGTTCAPTDLTGSFACQKSGASTAGATCKNYVNLPPECGDGMMCVATSDPTKGTCSEFCDATHACSGGKACTTFAIGSAKASVCYGGGAGGSGGSAGEDGGSDAAAE